MSNCRPVPVMLLPLLWCCYKCTGAAATGALVLVLVTLVLGAATTGALVTLLAQLLVMTLNHHHPHQHHQHHQFLHDVLSENPEDDI